MRQGKLLYLSDELQIMEMSCQLYIKNINTYALDVRYFVYSALFAKKQMDGGQLKNIRIKKRVCSFRRKGTHPFFTLNVSSLCSCKKLLYRTHFN